MTDTPTRPGWRGEDISVEIFALQHEPEDGKVEVPNVEGAAEAG